VTQVFRISEMIEGWKEVLTKMQEGSRWKVYIPPHLAYGENGAPPMIQPNATLVFIIELNKINKKLNENFTIFILVTLKQNSYEISYRIPQSRTR